MKALITGGGGFLGSHIARKLRDRGDNVTVLGRRRYPELIREGLDIVQADIRDAAALRAHFKGQDVVFHVAARAGIWGPRREFWQDNVEGAMHVIDACRASHVPRLIHTSSPSVVFDFDDLCAANESVPYATRYLAAYPESKALAEQKVLSANDANLATVALRPHLIFGPGDPHLLPRVIERARQGQLMQVGDGENLVDITYVENAADAHLAAADALSPTSTCAGRAYFISQGEPVCLWPWINGLLATLGLPAVTRRISLTAAYRIGWAMEALYGALRLRAEPRMTRFLALQLGKSHYFDITAARNDLKWQPAVSTEEGLERFVAWYRAGSPGGPGGGAFHRD